MSKPKKTNIRKKKGAKKAPSKYEQKIKIDATFEQLLNLVAEGKDDKGEK